MPLKPNAAPDEYSSPFFVRNKEFCEKYEQFILSLDGKVNGLYNAYSYNVLAEICRSSKWFFRIKKSTYTTSGNLFVSSKDEGLFLASQWSSNELGSGCPKFVIRRTRWLDFLRVSLFNDLWKLKDYSNYIIKCDEPSNFFISKLNNILSDLYLNEKVFTIGYESPKLFIDLRTDQIHKKEIMELLKI